MGDIFSGELPPLPVFQPLLTDLISADVEVPDIFQNTSETFALGL